MSDEDASADWPFVPDAVWAALDPIAAEIERRGGPVTVDAVLREGGRDAIERNVTVDDCVRLAVVAWFADWTFRRRDDEGDR